MNGRHAGYPSPLKRENCMNNGIALREGDGAIRQTALVSASAPRGEEGKAVNHREMMRSSAGKAMGVGRNDFALP